ncbi:PadR family transcriptional regulator [Pseudomonas sp. G11-1]|nr:PadR family transcriptional regulator [Pseudomonas sp. G11-1]MCO5790435.1 PadR family transcriptional regulator [Pseudomonas sp. G11-2]
MQKETGRQARQRGNPLTRGRKFSADELQLTLLWFLRDAPAHGYQLIKGLSELSQGYYSPSPGVVYPALTQLQERGLAEVEQQGKRKSYRISPAGLDYLQTHHERGALLIATLRHAAKKMQWLTLSGESEAQASAATGWLPEFIQARRALRTALLAGDDADHTQQRRMAEILQRAAADILSVSGNPDFIRGEDHHDQ